MTSLRFCKQDRVRKYRLGIFLFKVELGSVENNVVQTRNPIPPMLNQYPRNSLKQSFFFHFSLGIIFFVCLETLLSKIQWASLFHELHVYSLNFVKCQIIPSITQFEIKPCLLINEPQNLNQARKAHHTQVLVCMGVP